MKIFDEELKKIPVMGRDVVRNQPVYSKCDIVGLSNGWVSPEDHQKVVEDLTNARSSITNLMAQLDYYKKDKRFEAMAEEILSLKNQLEKQQPEIPEVPQFMDEWFKSDSLEDLIDVWYNHTSDLPENVKDYLDSLGEDITTSEYCYKEIVHLIARAKLDGYTVAKEKRFYLKHKSVLIFDPDSDDSDIDELYLGAGGNFVPYQHLAYKFTQQEIDSMETGSYEQIEVEE
nr:DUF1642 domain-containing protein [Lactococcus garvieae]